MMGKVISTGFFVILAVAFAFALAFGSLLLLGQVFWVLVIIGVVAWANG